MSAKPFTPSWLERLVRRCLAKEPDDRYQSMRDVVLDLRTPPLDTATPAPKPNHWPWLIAAATTMLAVAVAIFPLRRPAEPLVQLKYDINPPPGSDFAGIGLGGGSAISPDGKILAFVPVNAKGGSLLYLRQLDSLEARAMPGTENAGRPFWSPDSRSLGFVAGGKLKRVEVSGGAPVTLCDNPLARGATWNRDGVILFANRGAGLQRIAESGGDPVPLSKIDGHGELYYYYPQFLPGGKDFLFLLRHEGTKSGIYWGSLDGRPPVQILTTEFSGLYDASSGRLLYMQADGTLMARKLELSPPRLAGDPVVVAQMVRSTWLNGYAEFSISGNGILFYGRGSPESRMRFAWWDRAGKSLETIGQPFEASGSPVRLSGDGSRVAFGAGTPPDIWVMPVSSGIATRVSFSGGDTAQWSPDGRRIYYVSGAGFYRTAADGSGGEELLVKALPNSRLTSVSPDEKNLLWGFNDIFRLPLEGERKREPYLQTKFTEGYASFSPDGRWVAYRSDQSGRNEVYVEGFPERRGKRQISADGGTIPQWRADGKELYWYGGDGSSVMSASVELSAETVKSGRPEFLFRAPMSTFTTLDGKRFLVGEPEGGVRQALPMAVVTNWAAGLGK